MDKQNLQFMKTIAKKKTNANVNVDVMPFGKYTGVPLNEIETAYFVFLVENYTITPALKTKILDVIRLRLDPLLGFFYSIN